MTSSPLKKVKLFADRVCGSGSRPKQGNEGAQQFSRKEVMLSPSKKGGKINFTPGRGGAGDAGDGKKESGEKSKKERKGSSGGENEWKKLKKPKPN